MGKANGKIIHISEKQTFASGSEKVQFVIELDELDWQENKKIMAFDFFAGASKLEKMQNFEKFQKVGQVVDVDYDIECSAYNGKNGNEPTRYFTKLSAWKVFADKDQADNTITAGGHDSSAESEDVPF